MENYHQSMAGSYSVTIFGIPKHALLDQKQKLHHIAHKHQSLYSNFINQWSIVLIISMMKPVTERIIDLPEKMAELKQIVYHIFYVF